MKPKEFLNLPKIANTIDRRIQAEIRRLRRDIEVIPTGDEYEIGNCCGKKAYSSEKEALDHIESGRSKHSKKPFRAYQCDTGKWHLTAMTKKDWGEYGYKK